MYVYADSDHGILELMIAPNDAIASSHQGDCSGDVEALAMMPYIRKQRDKIDPKAIRSYLLNTGGWERSQLRNKNRNWERFLWLMAGDAVEELREREPRRFCKPHNQPHCRHCRSR